MDFLVMTVKVNTSRESSKILELGSFLYKASVDAPLATETHLTKAEVRRLLIPGYDVANDSSLIPDQQRARGGVILSVRMGVAYEGIGVEQHRGKEARSSPYSRPILLYLHSGFTGCVKITGVCFAPTAIKDV